MFSAASTAGAASSASMHSQCFTTLQQQQPNTEGKVVYKLPALPQRTWSAAKPFQFLLKP
jgi:hypothetical protein